MSPLLPYHPLLPSLKISSFPSFSLSFPPSPIYQTPQPPPSFLLLLSTLSPPIPSIKHSLLHFHFTPRNSIHFIFHKHHSRSVHHQHPLFLPPRNSTSTSYKYRSTSTSSTKCNNPLRPSLPLPDSTLNTSLSLLHDLYLSSSILLCSLTSSSTSSTFPLSSRTPLHPSFHPPTLPSLSFSTISRLHITIIHHPSLLPSPSPTTIFYLFNNAHSTISPPLPHPST